ncbi:fimbrial protein [Serratia marcescens]|uniref:fimbrial protein n=1 Tax=Serratia marcescens TaxID=615 RepID=UPI0034D39448
MTFRDVLLEPPPCTINDGGTVDVAFADRVGIKKVDGINYRQAIDYRIRCESPGALPREMQLTLKGVATTFDLAAVQTDNANLGIRIYRDAVPFTLNSSMKIDPASPPRIETVPAAKPGVSLAETKSGKEMCMKGKRRVAMWRQWLSAMLLTGASGNGMAADNLLFSGALVAEPCTLRPGDEDIRLDFGTVIDKYLYSHGRTMAKPFSLVLQDCDISLGNMVKLTFSGTESGVLPGLLAVDSSSQANGIALGLETAAGKPIILNKAGPGFTLYKGSNTLQFQVYIQGEPQAITQKKIGLGVFSAIATFSMEYQ